MSYEEGIIQVGFLGGSISDEFQVINNQFNYSWIYIENRSSWPLAMGTTPQNSSQAPAFPFTIRPLSIGCYPIDPSADVAIASTFAPSPVFPQTADGANTGGNGEYVELPRNVLYKLSTEGNAFVSELYPIDYARIVSRYVTVAGQGGRTDLAVAPPGTGTSIFCQGQDAPQDTVMVGVSVTLQNAGTAAIAELLSGDLITALGSAGGTLIGPVQIGTITPFSNLAANPTNPIQMGTDIIRLPGVQGINWFNNNPALNGSLSFVVSYYLGIPGRFAKGTV